MEKNKNNFFKIFVRFCIIFAVFLCFFADFSHSDENFTEKNTKYPEYNEIPYSFLFSLDGLKGIIPENEINVLADSLVVDHGILYCADKEILLKYSSNTTVNNILKLIRQQEKGQDCSPAGKFPQRIKDNLKPFTLTERRSLIRSIVFNMSHVASWSVPSRSVRSYTLTDRMYNIVRHVSEAPYSSGRHFCNDSEDFDYNLPKDDILDRCRFNIKQNGDDKKISN